MFSTIVVGTDGSQTARRAVLIAAELARESHAKLHVVYGQADPQTGSAGVGLPADSPWHGAREAVLDDAMADPALADVDAQSHPVTAPAAEALVRVAAEVGADLIVVGNRGMQPGRKEDPVAMLVALGAPCHVFIAKTT
jgi:nucleotide-binding universal stress UspA family protein